MSPKRLTKAVDELFPKCMSGRIMYAVPFALGPEDSPFTVYGVQLTDSPYIVLNTRIMAR